MSRPIVAAIRRTRSGSQVAPQAMAAGYTVAPYAVNPVRHSSCTRAGMSNRERLHDDALLVDQLVRALGHRDRLAPVDPGEVPEPCRLASASGTVPDAANTSCIGATWRSVPSTPGSPARLLPTQRLPSWPTFSSRVIAARSSSTRSGRGRVSSCHAPGPAGPRAAASRHRSRVLLTVGRCCGRSETISTTASAGATQSTVPPPRHSGTLTAGDLRSRLGMKTFACDA